MHTGDLLVCHLLPNTTLLVCRDVNCYCSCSNTWMTSDPEEWMAEQRPYSGVVDAVKQCPFPLYLATSKGVCACGACVRAC